MPNKIYQDILKVNIAKLIAESSAINIIGHCGIKGSIREFGLGNLILKYLPHEFDIGKGQIQDFNGMQSSETDIIIFHKGILPHILFSDDLGIYPIESCMYSLEVKTKSTANEIKTTIEKFNSLLKLNPLSPKNINHPFHQLKIRFKEFHPQRTYFAYSSDLSNKTEFERYKELDPQFDIMPAINIICVLGQGYWFFNKEVYKNNDNDELIRTKWLFCPSNDNYELIALIAGIINTLLQRKNYPSFGNYILDAGYFKIIHSNEYRLKDLNL